MAVTRAALPREKSCSHSYASLSLLVWLVSVTTYEREGSSIIPSGSSARPSLSILTFGFVSSLMLMVCGSSSVSSPVEQAKATQEGAKSSMDYTRECIAESKGATRTKTKNRIPTH